jgi:phosphoribosylanthranilate isomerase
MRIKICGITKLEQGRAIANLGATALGFICVPQSPRYVEPAQIERIIEQLPAPIDLIGVFAQASHQEISRVVSQTGLTGVQLHGEESPEFCQQLREILPGVELIKAFRLKSPESISAIEPYLAWVDTLLLDAYHPQLLGGTGQTLDWQILAQFRPDRPWFLAGGLTPDNILEALNRLHPQGIDLSSGVERAPGDKDLGKVTQLFEQLLTIKFP